MEGLSTSILTLASPSLASSVPSVASLGGETTAAVRRSSSEQSPTRMSLPVAQLPRGSKSTKAAWATLARVAAPAVPEEDPSHFFKILGGLMLFPTEMAPIADGLVASSLAVVEVVPRPPP